MARACADKAALLVNGFDERFQNDVALIMQGKGWGEVKRIGEKPGLRATRGSCYTRFVFLCSTEHGMKNVTITMDEKLLERVRVRAAREGQKHIETLAEAAELRVGKVLSKKEAMIVFWPVP